ncbi:glycoside hydrolase family 127 protein [Lederbergia sp. NSJ-179]|nr:glycoside hydrolase family 127 protein [Lederbergia sp. NSJ-179]
MERVWNNNDRVEIKIPMTLRLERMPDNPKRVAIMYGPLVLAGELGPLGDPEVTDFLYTPVFIPEGKSLSGWIQPVQGKTNTFRTYSSRNL